MLDIADEEKLMEDGADTAAYYLNRAVAEIDGIFGKGAAARSPALVAAFMQSAALDCASAKLCKHLSQALNRIADNVGQAGTLLLNPNSNPSGPH